MKTLGILGGMSWQSTLTYYQRINQLVNEQLGGLHSAKMVLMNVDFAEVEAMQRSGDWESAMVLLVKQAQAAEKAGAEQLIIATNTMHLMATEVQDAINIPLLHIADATGEVLKANNIDTVALLGTNFTMQMPFYRETLANHNVTTLTPNEAQRTDVHRIIYEELCHGNIEENSRASYQNIITDLHTLGAQGVILGCTEIGLLINDSNCSLPTFDTTEIHCQAAVKAMLG